VGYPPLVRTTDEAVPLRHGQWRKSPAELDFFRELNRRTAVRRCLRLRERQEKGTPFGVPFLYALVYILLFP